MRTRLGLEALEARDNPANNYWLCVDHDFTAAYNWTDGRPTADDHLYFDGGYSDASTGFFVGYKYLGPYATPSTHFFSSTYAGLHLVNGYDGVITFQSDTSFGVYEQTCGTTTGGSNPLTTTVTGTLTWTGGTINSHPTVAGAFNLAAGATGLIAPTNGGTVDLGSTLTLLGNEEEEEGSTLTVKRGTVNLNNGDGFRVMPLSRLNLQAKSGPTGFVKLKGVKQGLDKPVIVSENATWVVETDGRAAGDTSPSTVLLEMAGVGVFGNQGITTVRDRTELLIRGAGDADGGYSQFDKNTAVTNLEAGSMISTFGGRNVVINRGTLNIQTLEVNGQPVAVQPAAIISNVDQNGNRGTALIMMEDTILKMGGARYNRLLVRGDFETDGETRLAVSRTSDESDKVIVTGDVTMAPTRAKLTLRWGAPAAPLTVPVPTVWLLIESTGEGKKVKSLPNADRITYPSDPDPSNPEHLDLLVLLRNSDKELILKLLPPA